MPLFRWRYLLSLCLFFCGAQNVNHVFILAETEHVSLSHLQLAQSMREEAKKLEEFREKQKEIRKKVRFISTVMH